MECEVIVIQFWPNTNHVITRPFQHSASNFELSGVWLWHESTGHPLDVNLMARFLRLLETRQFAYIGLLFFFWPHWEFQLSLSSNIQRIREAPYKRTTDLKKVLGEERGP